MFFRRVLFRESVRALGLRKTSLQAVKNFPELYIVIFWFMIFLVPPDIWRLLQCDTAASSLTSRIFCNACPFCIRLNAYLYLCSLFCHQGFNSQSGYYRKNKLYFFKRTYVNV